MLINRRTEDLFGYARDELLGQPLTLLLPEAPPGEQRARGRDGRELVVQIRSS